MVKTKRLVAVALAILMILGSLSMTSYAWSARTSDGTTLTINTEIFREVNGEWVKTDKVDRGETRQEFILVLITIQTQVISCSSTATSSSRTLTAQASITLL